jgi:mannose-6-phosphate isomerase-like protein (cupin superfamily)
MTNLNNFYDPYHYWINMPRDNSNAASNPNNWQSWLDNINESLCNSESLNQYNYRYGSANNESHHDPFDYPYTPFVDKSQYNSDFYRSKFAEPNTSTDYGPDPFVININEASKENDTFRTALWTGSHLQVTLMSINVGDDIGLEMHPDVDQFLRVEEGDGIVRMGTNQNRLDFERNVSDDFAIMIPAGTWHNVINTGTLPLKLYSIYAPPQHPHGTVHETKADAQAAEEDNE